MHIVMKTSDALAIFKTKVRIAQEIGITKQAVSQWGETVPDESALKLLRKKPEIPHQEVSEKIPA